MAQLTTSVVLKRTVKILVISPLIITGLASTCAAAALACLSSLTIPSLKISDSQRAEFRLASIPPQLWSDLWSDRVAGLASLPERPQQGAQLGRFESRLPDMPSLLRAPTTAALAPIPGASQPGIQFIRFDVGTLAPMAFTRFCLTYPGECKPQPLLFRGDERIELNKARWSELETVNHMVNSSIYPERKARDLVGDHWLLSPDRGDCNDYAVTKRHQLIAMGWPARTVLLSEVVTAWGEHHLVTVVRTNSGDLVLDNLTDQIVPWSRAPYRWVRIQTPRNPSYWASISGQNV